MAITTTARFGLKIASDGLDPWPSRPGWMAMLQSIEDGAAMFAQGTWAARPAPTTVGRFYAVTSGANAGTLWYDTGSAWVAVGAEVQALTARAAAATAVPVTVRGAASQTAALQQWVNSSGAVLTQVLPSGQIAAPAGTAAAHLVTKQQLDTVQASVPVRLNQLSAPTAAVPMGGQKLTGLAAGTASTDAVTKGQLDAATGAAPTNLNELGVTGNVALGGYRITGLGAGSASTDAATKGQLDAVVAQIPTRLNQLGVTGNVSLGGFRITSLAAPSAAGDAVDLGTLNSVSNSLSNRLTWVEGRVQASDPDLVGLYVGSTLLGTVTPSDNITTMRKVRAGDPLFAGGWFTPNVTQVSAWRAAGLSSLLRVQLQTPTTGIVLTTAAFFDRSTGNWFFGYAVVVGTGVKSYHESSYSSEPIWSGLYVHTGSGTPKSVTPTVPFEWQAGDIIVIGGHHTMGWPAT